MHHIFECLNVSPAALLSSGLMQSGKQIAIGRIMIMFDCSLRPQLKATFCLTRILPQQKLSPPAPFPWTCTSSCTSSLSHTGRGSAGRVFPAINTPQTC